jgi:hypothetical protein
VNGEAFTVFDGNPHVGVPNPPEQGPSERVRLIFVPSPALTNVALPIVIVSGPRLVIATELLYPSYTPRRFVVVEYDLPGTTAPYLKFATCPLNVFVVLS